ncbi:MAG: hypothetical protein GEV11_06785 [Streptosporangiales bacterium]|nr:hypothetical protein [Streptosporangiales bacterium]
MTPGPTTTVTAAQAVTGRYFEDYRLGEVITSGGRTVSAADIAAFIELAGDRDPIHTDPASARVAGFPGVIAPGPMATAIFFGLLYDTGLARGTTLAALDTHWTYRRPVVAGSTLRFAMTITRRRRASAGDRGVLNRAIDLYDQDGIVGTGTSAGLVRCRDAEASAGEYAADPCSPAWTERLAELLNGRPAFVDSAASFDGVIGLACGDVRTQLKIYRGRVIDHGRWTPDGPDFTVGGDELAWAELATAPVNDYLRRVMTGRFSATGNGYTYQRLTKTLVLMWDAIRDLTAGEGG